MSLRIITTPIASSDLARSAVEGRSQWHAPRPATAAAWKSRAHQLLDTGPGPQWLESLEGAFAASGAAADRLRRAGAGGLVVTTGQQPGLFGGPLYTWWKAFTALALADRIEAVTGIPTAPVFWAATDDSDFAEASWTTIATAEGAERLELPPHSQDGVPLADVPLAGVGPLLDRLVAAAGSAPHPTILQAVRQAYADGTTVGAAYLTLLRRLLEPLGVAVLDAAHQSVRICGHATLTAALSRAGEIERALAERDAALAAAGHRVQVKQVRGRSLVFDAREKRTRISVADSASLSAHAAPGSLSPNVLLRPLLERAIVPTVAYVGGPAEIAYFAQVTAVAEALQVPPPLVLPRWSGIVIEPRVDRILERYRVEPGDFRDPHAVESRFAREALPDDLKQTLSALSRNLVQAAGELRNASGTELVSDAVIHGFSSNLERRVQRLERRFAASVKRRGSQALRDLGAARAALYPLGLPQERALNFIPLSARYGDDLTQSVLGEVRRHAESLA